MDIYDRAAAATEQMQVPLTPGLMRPLTLPELTALVDYLLGTEMPVPEALRHLRYGIHQVTLDDLDRLGARIARCRHCQTWTALRELINQVCPSCLKELAL
jgi:hypothetical protein